MKLDELERHRIEPKEGKRNVYDFALWKAAKQGEPSWRIKLKVDGKEREFNGQARLAHRGHRHDPRDVRAAVRPPRRSES